MRIMYLAAAALLLGLCSAGCESKGSIANHIGEAIKNDQKHHKEIPEDFARYRLSESNRINATRKNLNNAYNHLTETGLQGTTASDLKTAFSRERERWPRSTPKAN